MTAAGAFEQYAAWYNAFNEAKDYAAEIKYLLEQVERWRPAPRSWLDIGCGTGSHVAALAARGISAEGVDASQAMIAQARLAHPDIPFHVGRAEKFHLSGQRDVVSMLFHVLDYQTSDAAIRQTIQNVAAHLAQDGVFVFDFWNTDGVLRDPPLRRARQTRIGERTLWRISRPTEDRKLRRIDIRFEFRWDSPEGPVTHEEVHSMRHFTATELTEFLRPAGLHILSCEGWMTHRPLAPRDWYGLICSRRSAADVRAR